jgi:hypothetical protein
MARYHFHVHECGTVIDDEEGLERPNLESVRHEALISAREIMSNEVKNGKLCLSCHIEVQDETGQVVLTLPFKEAVQVVGI